MVADCRSGARSRKDRTKRVRPDLLACLPGTRSCVYRKMHSKLFRGNYNLYFTDGLKAASVDLDQSDVGQAAVSLSMLSIERLTQACADPDRGAGITRESGFQRHRPWRSLRW